MTQNAKKLLNSMFGEDVKNVLLQHKSWLTSTVIEQFSKGRLDLMRFPYFSGDGQSKHQEPCKNLIVFMVGGVTFEEAKEVAQFVKTSGSLDKAQGQFKEMAGISNNQIPPIEDLNIVLGGTFIHNSKTFLADVSQIGSGSGSSAFEIE